MFIKAPCGCYFLKKVIECPEHGKFKITMKKIIISGLLAISFAGCATNNFCDRANAIGNRPCVEVK